MKGMAGFKFVAGLAAGLLVLVLPAASGAKYITDITKVGIRAARATDAKILATLNSGDTVEVVEEGADWSRVRLADGREGWVSSRMLTDQKPCSAVLAELRQERDNLSMPGGVPEEVRRLKTEIERLTAAQAEAETRAQTATRAYDALKNDSGEVLKFQSEAARLATALDQANQRAEILAGEINRLENRQLFRWFFSGAGVLFAGLILGYSARAKRRRSSLL